MYCKKKKIKTQRVKKFIEKHYKGIMRLFFICYAISTLGCGPVFFADMLEQFMLLMFIFIIAVLLLVFAHIPLFYEEDLFTDMPTLQERMDRIYTQEEIEQMQKESIFPLKMKKWIDRNSDRMFRIYLVFIVVAMIVGMVLLVRTDITREKLLGIPAIVMDIFIFLVMLTRV